MQVLLTILPWILPILLGAAIGFITNKIAIKMLFRPLTEKRIFGIRVPFTPGIIPKQRRELAESIGRMVSRELLTPEVILKQTRSESFRNDVEKGLSSVTEKALTLRFHQLIHHDPTSSSMFHADSEPRLSENELRRIIASLFYDFIRSNAFAELLKSLIYSGVSYIADLSVGEIITDQKKGEEIITGLLDRLSGDEKRERILSWLEGEIDSWFSRDIQVRAIIPKEMVDGAVHLFDSLYPEMVTGLTEWLREEDTKAELVVHGKIFIRDAIEKLRGLQKFFIRAGRYHETIEEKMPDIVEDGITIFYNLAMDEVNREGILRTFRGAVMNWRRRHLKNAFGGGDGFKKKARIVAEKLLSALSHGNTQERIVLWLKARLGKAQSLTLGAVMEDYLKMDRSEAAEGLTNLILQWIAPKDQAASQSIGDTLYNGGSGYFRENQEMTIGTFFGIHPELKSQLDHYMTIKVIEVMEENVPDILQTFDVYSVVVDKINELVIEDVEKLLMMVIEKQLKWINIFGAILGGIIGVSQIVVNSLL